MRRILRLGLVDLKQSLRDPLAAASFVLPFVAALVMRLLVLSLSGILMQNFSFDLLAYLPAFVGMMVLVPAVFTGMIAGFLLLDERDEGTFIALQVTPVSRTAYALYRLFVPVVISLISTLFVPQVFGLARLPQALLLPAALLGAMGSPFWAMLMGTFASNKIEGIAVLKLSGFLMALPAAALFIPTALLPLLWPVPFFWPFWFAVRALSGAAGGDLALIFAGGVAVHAVYLLIMLRRLAKRSYS